MLAKIYDKKSLMLFLVFVVTIGVSVNMNPEFGLTPDELEKYETAVVKDVKTNPDFYKDASVKAGNMIMRSKGELTFK